MTVQQAAPQPRPQIAVLGRWQRLAGFAYGLRQPCVVGRMRMESIPAARMQDLAAALAAATGLPRPAGSESPAVECARLIGVWTCIVQVRARIPVQEAAWAHLIASMDGTGLDFEVALPTHRPEATGVALRWVTQAANRLLREPSALPDQDAFDQLDAALQAFRPAGVNPFSIPLAACRLGLPLRIDVNGVHVIGTGVHSRWMRTTQTDRTPALGIKLAGHKSSTALAMRAAGLPGAQHELVADADQAVAVAGRFGYPVVVKPDDLQQGKGVAAGLRNEAEVREAFEQASKLSRRILLERHADGWTHRLTVSHGRVIRAVKRQPGGVTGDGVHTVRQLVALEAASELGQRRLRHMGKEGIVVDAEATDLLAVAGLTPESIPQAGRFVRMRRRDNFNAGGTNIDLAVSAVHPDNLQLAIDAAMHLRLDLAGVDLIIEDVGVSWLQCSALICEVNALPQLYAREDDHIYDRILMDVMGGGPSRIPARLRILAGAPDEAQARAVADALADSGINGLSCAQGLVVDGRRVTAPFANSFDAACALLARLDVRGAMCLMTEDDVLRQGMPLDGWDMIEWAQHDPVSTLEPPARNRLARIVGLHTSPNQQTGTA